MTVDKLNNNNAVTKYVPQQDKKEPDKKVSTPDKKDKDVEKNNTKGETAQEMKAIVTWLLSASNLHANELARDVDKVVTNGRLDKGVADKYNVPPKMFEMIKSLYGDTGRAATSEDITKLYDSVTLYAVSLGKQIPEAELETRSDGSKFLPSEKAQKYQTIMMEIIKEYRESDAYKTVDTDEFLSQNRQAADDMGVKENLTYNATLNLIKDQSCQDALKAYFTEELGIAVKDLNTLKLGSNVGMVKYRIGSLAYISTLRENLQSTYFHIGQPPYFPAGVKLTPFKGTDFSASNIRAYLLGETNQPTNKEEHINVNKEENKETKKDVGKDKKDLKKDTYTVTDAEKQGIAYFTNPPIPTAKLETLSNIGTYFDGFGTNTKSVIEAWDAIKAAKNKLLQTTGLKNVRIDQINMDYAALFDTINLHYKGISK